MFALTARVSSARGVRYIQYAAGSPTLEQWTPHAKLRAWVTAQVAACTPARVHLVSGSDAENAALLETMCQTGTLQRLNRALRPNSFLARSPPSDVARVESRTFICSERAEDAGALNNWVDPAEMKKKLAALFRESMEGRTMFVSPFSMGPLGSPLSAIGVQVTDSPYAVVNMRIMTRGTGAGALKVLGSDGFFVPCLHSVGSPLKPGQDDVPWPQNADKTIAHFPESREIASYGSGYGGNALLGKKCYALRIASVMARDEGWFAEHMCVLGITSPQGKKTYVAAAFPSACGKTNFAMLQPSLPGWRVSTVGDDIAWMRFDAQGQLRAINPENGFFGVAPGTNAKSNANALASCRANTIFTNVALTKEGDVWWEGLSKPPPSSAISWLRREWSPGDGNAAHPNSRFTAPADQCPSLDPNWNSSEGVPISAIIFGGRRSDTMPLCVQSLDWEHGVFNGATMMSETTSAAESASGELRADPMAMRPFIGYNVADYWSHWLNARAHQLRAMRALGAPAGATPVSLPRIFNVNWFQRDPADKSFLWPGFGDNVRVLEWIAARVSGTPVPTIETPIGHMPDFRKGGLNVAGCNVSPAALERLFAIDADKLRAELQRSSAFLDTLGSRVPQELRTQSARLRARLDSAAPPCK